MLLSDLVLMQASPHQPCTTVCTTICFTKSCLLANAMYRVQRQQPIEMTAWLELHILKGQQRHQCNDSYRSLSQGFQRGLGTFAELISGLSGLLFCARCYRVYRGLADPVRGTFSTLLLPGVLQLMRSQGLLCNEAPHRQTNVAVMQAISGRCKHLRGRVGAVRWGYRRCAAQASVQ